jgi:catechol 2,3-dioxygenase-like lactoylglutathione lyase family enzyme
VRISTSGKEIRVKRLHVHVAVADLQESVRFYSTLFAAEPTVLKDDYAKWMLDDPRVNFATSAHEGDEKGIRHLGVQAENTSELSQVCSRLRAAERPVLEEGRTTCCYARSEKSWIADPDGVVWEAFHTDGEATTYGDNPALGILADSLGEGQCCLPTSPAPGFAA